MSEQAITEAERLWTELSLPLTDENFNPKMAREIITSLHTSLGALVSHIRNTPTVLHNGVKLKEDMTKMFEPLAQDIRFEVRLSDGMWVVDQIQETTQPIAILADHDDAILVAQMLDAGPDAWRG